MSGRMKLKQILNAFQDIIDSNTNKYVCPPCSNCKWRPRDLLDHYRLWDENRIFYDGLVELVVKALEDAKKPVVEWEWH